MALRPSQLLLALAFLFGIVGLAAAWAWGLGYGVAALAAAAALGATGALTAEREREDESKARAAMVARQALDARFEQQQRIVDALADGLDAALFICNREGVVLYANPPSRRLFGHDDPAGKGILATTLSVELERLVTDAAGGSEAQRGEIGFAYPREWIGLASAWPEPGQDRIFVSIYEITELRRLERSRKDFVANVSHELRTPMTIIRGYAETMLDDGAPETSARMLPRIVEEVDRLSSIVGDLLTLSVSESGTARKEPCDLAEVVQSVVERLGPKALDKGLELTYEGPESLDIRANPAQIGQVALNLVDNALNYTSQGSVTVSLAREGERAILAFRDTGIGIATEHVERVFERFYRVDRGRSRATGGTGLGLSIVRHIVEAHGGTLALQSALNRGSTFTVTLPVE